LGGKVGSEVLLGVDPRGRLGGKVGSEVLLGVDPRGRLGGKVGSEEFGDTESHYAQMLG